MKSIRLFLSIIFLCLIADFSCMHDKKYIHGGCCLSQGTLVRLSNGKDKLIENLKAGDTVLAYDRVNDKFVSSRVLKMFQTEHDGFVKLTFKNKVEDFMQTAIVLSADHPVWVVDKGWCSTEPETTKRVLMMKDVKKLEAGDNCYRSNDMHQQKKDPVPILLTAIEKIKEPVRAYTIVQLENKLDCFIANGIVVGTEAMSAENGGE
ncbi:MAG TPA: hypothetical protein VFJ43_06455 [Bacteroidia bacterium]|nr:hypothetical protein [Bacteroidia bacterium]